MIKFYRLFFLLFTCLYLTSSTELFSQGWTTQSSGVSNALNAVFLTDVNSGTAVGASGKILHTTNGGLTWPSQSCSSSQPLNGVFFPTSTIGFVVGNSGTILHTTNAGATWASQSSGASSHLNGVSFADANNGIAVGNDGAILRTTNGGSLWTSQTSGSSTLHGVVFSTPSIATIAGNSGTILRTSNGGAAWSTQSSGTSSELYSVSFSDANTGTVVGAGGTILRTTNGGTTWIPKTSGTSENLRGVFFKTQLKGTAVGNDGKILRTTNGGATWISQSSGSEKDLAGVHFADENTGNVVGSNGKILRTTTGGTGCPTITLAPLALPAGSVGTAYSQTITSSGGASPYSYAVTSGVLPSGLTLSSSGNLAGTPSVSGVFSFAITSSDNNNCQGNRSYSIAINCLSLTVAPPSLPAGTQGAFYNQTLTASGGTSPYTFTVSGGSLPPGLGLSSSGVLSGTPSVAGSSSFTVRATDAHGCTGDRSYTLTINCPVITVAPSSLPAGTAGTAYSQTLTASGASAPYSFAVTAGSLPAGLTLSSSGVLSGTPSAVGSSSFTVTASDAHACTGNRAYTLTMNCAVVIVAPSSLPAGTVGSAYTQTITASGGNAPYTFAVTAGSLPLGLILNSGGLFSGTPGSSGTFSFTISATDVQGCAGSRSYSMNIGCATLVLAPASLPPATAGTSYSQILSSSSGTAPYSYAVTGGALPPGITLSAGGTVSGIPATPGSYNFSITSTDAQSCTGLISYTFLVNCPAISVLPASIPGSTVGSSYSQTLSASGGTGPYSFSISSGTLPGGLGLSSGGLLSGTTTASGTFVFTVAAVDANGCTGSRGYSVTIGCPSITLSSLPTGIVGTSYSQTITAAGAAAPVTFAVTSGTLPTGLTLSPTGVLSGTPSTAGSFTFAITASDVNNCTGNQSYSISMICPTITLSGLPNGSVGVAYNQTVTSIGGTAPSTFALTAGALPTGLSLSSSGILSGVPTSSGSFTFTITSTDANGCQGSQTYTISMNCSPLMLTPASLPNGTVGIGYTQTISGSGGTSPYAFSIVIGTLPAGLALSSSGDLNGTPEVNGVYAFDISVTDVYGCSHTQRYSITIGTCPTISLSPALLPNGTSNISYSEILSSTGGTAPYTFIVSGGTLPPGLSVSGSGTLSGTPTSPGSFTFTISSTDDIGCSGSRSYTLTICSTIGISGLSDGIVGTPYNEALIPTGGTAPYTFANTSGTLPSGLALSGTGVLSGTPTVAGTSSFTIEATDANGCTGSQAYSIAMNCPVMTINPPTLPNGSVGAAYSQTLLGSGGTTPFAFSVTSGTLPNGIILSSAGVLSGAAVSTGNFSFTAGATDAHGCTTSRIYSIGIECAAITIAPPALGSGVVGSPYSETLSAGGGTSPYTYSVASGSLPNGLTLLSSGLLSGTPSASGNFAFTAVAIDAQGCSETRGYSLTINCPSITLNPASLPNGSAYAAYSLSVTAAGGSGPYSYAIGGGSLPSGLVMTSSGTITGIPATVGGFSFTVTATDVHNCSGSRNYTLSIVCPTLTISPSALSNGTVGIAYSRTFSGSGGSSPYTFGLSGGTPPPGLSLSPAGVLGGAPTQVGVFSFTVFITDAQGCTGSLIYSLTVDCPVITVSPSTLPAGISGLPYNQPLSPIGGTSPYSYAISGGSLPPGVTLSAAGLLSGTPSAAGDFTFTTTSTDAQGCSGTRSYTLTVNCPAILLTPSSIPGGSIGAPYSQVLLGSGGIPPYTFSLTSGSLPSGMMLSSGGILSGTPTVGENFSLTVTATDAAGCQAGQSYSLSISSSPGFGVTPASIDFGSLLVGATKRDSVTVTNPGTGLLTIYSASSDDGNFNITPNSSTISPGGSRRFYINFTPAGTGIKGGNILFTHSATGSPDTVVVTGTGVAPVFSILTSLSFGDVILGSSKSDSIRIQNSGTTTLTISSAASDNPEFSVSPSASSLPAGAIQTFLVTFSPTSLGAKSGNIIFVHDGAATPNAVPIDGTGIVNLTAVKFRDIDGNTSTVADQSPKVWNFTIYADTVDAAHLLSEANSTSLTASISLAGKYIVCESDSAPLWTRINGNQTRYDTVMVTTTGVIDTFVNFKVNGITFRSFEDGDGIFSTTGDRISKQWHLEIRKDSLRGLLIASGNAASVAVPTLGDGTYYCIESDSANWLHLGYVIDGGPFPGNQNAVRVELADGQSATVDLVIARTSFYKSYRSFSPRTLSQLRPVKKKVAAQSFCAQFVNTTGGPVNGLRVVFTRFSLSGVVVNISNHAPFPNASSLDGRTWDFTGTSIADHDNVAVCGVSNFGSPLQIAEWEWMVNGIPMARQPKFTPPGQTPLLAMPNFANIRNEVFTRGGFSLPRTDGLVIGIPRIDSVKKYGWVRLRTAKALRGSLVDRSGYHVGFARGFDVFFNGVPFVKEQPYLRPMKQNNHLFGEILVMKFAVTASALGTTPNGFGELLYDEGPGNPLSGLTISQIAARVDSALTLWRDGALHGWNYDNFDSTLTKINRAFDGAVDTMAYMTRLVVAGVRPLVDVPFLHPNPNAIPLKIEPVNVPGKEVPEQFTLYQNYPNPFNPSTTIEFVLPAQAIVSLKIYNLLGQEVAAPVDHQSMDEGSYSVDFDAHRLASGVYFYRLVAETVANDDAPVAGSFVSVRKMLLVK